MPRIDELLATLLRRRTPDGDPLSDAVLLERFARGRDQAAFELLVWRHGPMVLATCRRVLRDSHAAEDAFQAAFLVLSRKADSVRGSAAGWLHRVALRVCLRMKRRLPPVSLDAETVASPNPDTVETAEQSAILDEEVSRLPEFLRLPVILCHLQGHTTEHVANSLGIPRGTVLSRLANARKRLAVRLSARGVAPALAAVAVTDLSADAGRTVAEAAAGFTLGNSAHSVPVQLALEVLSMTTRRTAAVAAGVLVLVAGLGTGVGFVAAQGAKVSPSPTARSSTAVAPVDAATANARIDDLQIQLREFEQRLHTIQHQEAETEVIRLKAKALEQRHSELLTSKGLLPPSPSPELIAARQRLDAASRADVPADVLAEAVKAHPKVAEAQKKLTAKEDELRASKLPKGDAGRKTLDDERAGLFKELQAAQKEVAPEVGVYLRAPGMVAAKKAVAAAEETYLQAQDRAKLDELECEQVAKELVKLRRELNRHEQDNEDLVYLKEKRTQLRREMLELSIQLDVARMKEAKQKK